KRGKNVETSTNPSCGLSQKFEKGGNHRGHDTTLQGTYFFSPSSVLLGSINSNDPKRIAYLLEKSLAKWDTLKREERLLPTDPRKQLADIKRPERYYPEGGLVLNVTSRDLPREGGKPNPAKAGWRETPQEPDLPWST